MCFIWQQRIKWRWRCISGQSENLLLWGTDKRLDFLMTGWKYSFERKDILWKILSRIEFKGLPNKGRLDESESRGHYNRDWSNENKFKWYWFHLLLDNVIF